MRCEYYWPGGLLMWFISTRSRIRRTASRLRFSINRLLWIGFIVLIVLKLSYSMFLAVEFLIRVLALASFVKAGVVRLGVIDEDLTPSITPSGILSEDLQSYQVFLVDDEPIINSEVGFDEDSVDQESAENDPKVLSNREWKKLRRYVNRQLKVPQRYLKQIVRSFNKVVKLRSADNDGTRAIRRTSSPSLENLDIEFLDDKPDYFLSRDIIINRCKNLIFLRKVGIDDYYSDYDE